MKEKLLAILAVIGTVVTAVLFFFKLKPNKVLAENEAVKEKLKEVDKEIVKNNSQLMEEEVIRLGIKENTRKEQDETVTSSDVVDFFNNRK